MRTVGIHDDAIDNVFMEYQKEIQIVKKFKVEACVPKRGDGWSTYPSRAAFVAATGHKLPWLTCWFMLRTNPGQRVAFKYGEYSFILEPEM